MGGNGTKPASGTLLYQSSQAACLKNNNLKYCLSLAVVLALIIIPLLRHARTSKTNIQGALSYADICRYLTLAELLRTMYFVRSNRKMHRLRAFFEEG